MKNFFKPKLLKIAALCASSALAAALFFSPVSAKERLIPKDRSGSVRSAVEEGIGNAIDKAAEEIKGALEGFGGDDGGDNAAPGEKSGPDGGTLGFLHRVLRVFFIRQHIEDRLPPPSRYAELGKLPEDLRLAAVAALDKDFYRHGGFDAAETFGDFFFIITGGGFGDIIHLQGGPKNGGGEARIMPLGLPKLTKMKKRRTITGRLVDNLFARRPSSGGRDALAFAAFERFALVVAVEARCEKDEILEYYLNSAKVGASVGVKDICYRLFAKPPAEMTAAQCALVVALIAYHDEAAAEAADAEADGGGNASGILSGRIDGILGDRREMKERRDAVIDAMQEAGFLRAPAAAQAKDEPLNVR